MASTLPIARPPAPTRPVTRVAVARYADLRRAQQGADRLTNRRIPLSAIHVAAAGVRPAQPATNWSNPWDAAMDGLRVGAIFGAIFAAIWSLTGLADGSAGIAGVIFGAFIGGVFGIVVAVIGHWGESDPQRDPGLIEADEFDLLVDDAHEDEARSALRSARDTNGRATSGRWS